MVDSLAELVRERAERTPDAVFLRFEGASLTYAQLYERACRMATCLVERSGGDPPHLGLLADNVPDAFVSVFAASLAGGVAALLDTGRKGHDLAEDIATAGVDVMVVEPKYAPLLDDGTFDAFVADDGLLAIDREAPPGLIEPRESLEAALVASPALDPEAAPAPGDLAALTFTGGERSLAVRWTHRRLLATAARAAEEIFLGAEDRLYSAVPLGEGTTLPQAVLPVVRTGACLVAARHPAPAGTIRDLVRERCTHLHYSGPQLADLVDEGLPTGLKAASGSGASVEVIDAVSAETPVLDALWWPEGDTGVRRTGAGPVAAPDTVSVRDQSEAGCPPGEPGEIFIASPDAFEGYHGNEIATRERLREGVFRSGRRGALDSHRHLSVLDDPAR